MSGRLPEDGQCWSRRPGTLDDNGQMPLTCGFPPLAGTDRGTAHREGRDRQESHVSFPGPFAHRHKSSGAISRKRAR
jgi:hypothetical protein